mgnify:CR=1 FL=1
MINGIKEEETIMKKLLAAALSGVLTAGIILGGTGLSTKAAETETETESETKKTTSVKTGDDTPIAPYMALMLASMAMLAAEFICRRKRRSEK